MAVVYLIMKIANGMTFTTNLVNCCCLFHRSL